jgi:hypothetical protein
MEEEEEEESTPEDYQDYSGKDEESTEVSEEEGSESTEQLSHAGDESDEIITEITSSSEEEENEEWEKEKIRALLAGESIELKIVDIITIITEISDDDNGEDLEQPSSGDKVQQLRHQNIDELMELEDTGRRPETSEEIENIETSYDDDDYDEEEGEPQSIEDQLAGHPQNIDELMEFEDTGRRPETSKETEDIDLTYDMPEMHEDVEEGEGNIEHIPPAKYDEEGPPFEEHVFEEDDPNAPAEYFDQDQTSTPKHPPKGVQPSPPQYISPKFPSEPSIRVVQPLPEYILNQFKKPEVESPAEAEEPHIPSYIQHPTQEEKHQVEPTELLYVHHHPKLEEQPLEDDVNEKPYPLFPRPPAGVQEDEPAIVTESDLPDPVVTLPTLLEMPEYDEEYDETGPEEHERRPFSFLRPPSVEDDMLEYLPELPTPNIQKQPIAPEYHRDEPEKHVERKPFPIVEADMPEPTEAPVIERDMPESDTKKPMEEYDETEPEKAEKPSSPLLRPPIVEHDMPESVVGTSPTPIIDMPMAAESREMEPEKPERPSFFEPFPFVQDYYMPEPTIEMPPSEYHHLEPEIHDRRIFPFLRPPIVDDDMPEPSEAPVIERDMPVSDDTSTKKPTAEYHEMEPPGRPTLLEPLPFEQDYMPEPTIEMPPSEYHHLEPEIPEFDATEEPSFLPGPPAERRPPKMGEFGELPPSRLMRISEDPKLAYKPAGKMFEDEFTSTEETQRGRPREESEEEQVEDEEEVDGKMPTDISKQQLILEDNQKGRPIDRIQPMEPMQFFTGKPAYQIPSRIMLEQHKPFLIGPKEEEDRIPRILETSSEEEEEDEESTPSIPLAPAPPQLGVQLETPKILESTSEEEEEEEEIPAEEEMTSYYPNNNKVEREKAPPPRPAPPNFERPTPRSVMEGMPPPPWLVRKWPNLQYQRIRSIPPPSLFYHEIGHEEEWENDDDDEKERRGSSAEEETDEKYGEKTGRLQTFIPFKRESEKTEFEPLPSSSEEEEDDCEEDYYDEDDDDQSEESEEYLDEPTTTPNEKYVIEARLLAILGLLQLQMRPATVWESDHLLPSSLPPQRPRNPYARTTTPVRQPWKGMQFKNLK